MANPKVSVIVTTYNRAHMVTETIDSILSQTFQDFELILVDNYSSDNTRGVIKAYTDKRLRYFRHQNNGVIAVNRNYGVSKAQGEYIAFCDDDDLWRPEKLARQTSELEKDSRIGLVCNNEIHFDENGDHGSIFKAGLQDSDFSFESLIWKNHISSSTVLVRRAVLDDVGLMDEGPEIMTAEDYELWLRIARKYSVKYIDAPLGKYRTHGGVYRKGHTEPAVRDKLVYRRLLEKGVLSPELYRKRVNHINRQALASRLLSRSGIMRYALLARRAVDHLDNLRQKRQETKN